MESRLSKFYRFLPSFPLPQMYRRYDQSALFDAYFAVTEEGLSLEAASKRFGVPRRTLGDRIHGRTPLERLGSGPQSILSEGQEERLVTHIKRMMSLGYGYTRKEVIELASDFAVSLGLRTRDSPLSKTWYQLFMKRWPTLKLVLPRGLDVYRAVASRRENVNDYFVHLEECLESYNLVNKPHLIYNVDEKGLVPHYEPPKVLSIKSSRPLAVTPPRGATTTLIAAGNAVGTAIPPFFIFKGTHFQEKFLEKATPGTAGDVSESGWSNSDIFRKYMKNHFFKYLQRPTPDDHVIVIYDGHKSHVNVDLLDWAKENRIVLFVLPAHTSHFLQPLDVACFGPLEKTFVRMKHTMMRGHPTGHLTAPEVCEISCKAYQEALKPHNLVSGFSKTGICPLIGIDAVDPVQLTPATVFGDGIETTAGGQDFFADREERLNIKRKETKKRNVIGTIVGGREITNVEVEASIRDHVAQAKKPRPSTAPGFNPEECCCVCMSELPPLDLLDANEVNWAECDHCHHWVHLNSCIATIEVTGDDSFSCPCCETEQ